MDDAEDEAAEPILSCPNRLMRFPEGTILVQDADEEILELYMDLASTKDDSSTTTSTTGGLGFLDSSSSLLELDLVLRPPTTSASTGDISRSRHAGRKTKIGKKVSEKAEVVVNIKIQQDLNALKGRRGDTGSVLWRSSLHLARNLLTQHYFPSLAPLFEPELLRQARVLELGAGTGLLAVLLSPLCAHYAASDRIENLKLVQRNLELNGIVVSGLHAPLSPKKSRTKFSNNAAGMQSSEVELEEIDWVDISNRRQRRESGSPRVPLKSLDAKEGYDLIIAVDCIYNENLVKPLVDTLHEYCPPGGKTVVWVVVELRSSDVLTLFMDTWLQDGADHPWTIVRLPHEAMGDWEGTRPRWVGWFGWRE